MKESILKSFAKYVSLNVLGMIGLSCYILVDTFFISKVLGAMGIAALNFSIPIYSLIHGTGLMIGIGGATRYSILKSQKEDKGANRVFTTCIKTGALIGVAFGLIGIFGSKSLALILGADMSTLTMTKTYLTTILCFAPVFIMNNIILAFVRNDNNPNLSMVAMLFGSLCNIVLDYIFMFPLDMGIFGAAFATGLAPIISLGILTIHFVKRENSLRYVHDRMWWFSICDIFSLGLFAFITEVSSAVVLITFNLVIMSLEGSLGVASYGIVANIALVGVSIFTGIAQGIQPLVSKAYGLKNYVVLRKIIKFAFLSSLAVASVIYMLVFFNADGITRIFNSEQNLEIARITKAGLRIYFAGFFFAGINIIMAAYLSATELAKDAFVISVTRGCIIIVPMVLLLSSIWGMTGLWMTFVLTEGIVTIITVFMASSKKKIGITQT